MELIKWYENINFVHLGTSSTVYRITKRGEGVILLRFFIVVPVLPRLVSSSHESSKGPPSFVYFLVTGDFVPPRTV